jgi:hypothetical protein
MRFFMHYLLSEKGEARQSRRVDQRSQV